MSKPDDEKWQGLLSRSMPTFAADTVPPYGFMTATLAGLRMARQQQELERMGWRALLASVAALAITACITLSLNRTNANDLEPGVGNILQVENVPLS
jgi:nucleoside permease NupC